MTEQEQVLEIVADLCTGIEAVVVKAKAEIARLVGVTGWNPSNINWVQAEGTKGPYEKSDEVDNPEFKTMLKDLATHNGKMRREGYFYWTFQNGTTCGRKRVTT